MILDLSGMWVFHTTTSGSREQRRSVTTEKAIRRRQHRSRTSSTNLSPCEQDLTDSDVNGVDPDLWVPALRRSLPPVANGAALGEEYNDNTAVGCN